MASFAYFQYKKLREVINHLPYKKHTHIGGQKALKCAYVIYEWSLSLWSKSVSYKNVGMFMIIMRDYNFWQLELKMAKRMDENTVWEQKFVEKGRKLLSHTFVVQRLF